MTNRRSIFAALAASLVAAAALWKKRDAAPRFVERTPPGDRYRTFKLGDRQLHLREDLLRSGWVHDVTFHGENEEKR